MKKFILTSYFIMAGLLTTALAQNTVSSDTYTDKIVVKVDNNASAPQDASAVVSTMDDGTYSLSLKNFILRSDDGSEIPVGNINVPHINGVSNPNGVISFTYQDDINITNGDDPNFSWWMGPGLGPVPLNMTGEFNENQLYCDINITMAVAGMTQNILVTFGKKITGDRIETVTASTGNETVNVYTLQGTLVRRQVPSGAALNGLPKGTYIVGRHKVIKK